MNTETKNAILATVAVIMAGFAIYYLNEFCKAPKIELSAPPDTIIYQAPQMTVQTVKDMANTIEHLAKEKCRLEAEIEKLKKEKTQRVEVIIKREDEPEKPKVIQGYMSLPLGVQFYDDNSGPIIKESK